MPKKKLLYISQVFPYPADGGGKIKTLQTLTALARDYTIHAFFVSERNPTAAEKAHLITLGISKVTVLYNPKILASVKDDYANLFRHFLRGIPHYVFQYSYAPATRAIKKVLAQFKPDIIHVDHLNMAQYLPTKKEAIWILEHHNVEFYLLLTRFIHSGKLTRKLYLLIETVLTYWFERTTISRFDHVFAISRAEEQRIRHYFKKTNVSTQPLVYPQVSLHRKPSMPPTLLFVGGLGWPPNEDAVEWFITTMFPAIRQKFPTCCLTIVGKHNPELLRRLPLLPGVTFWGYQKDLKPFLEQATVFIMPFRMGGGVRIKSLTALAAGIPLVATPLGVEGLRVTAGKEYLCASTPSEFVQQIEVLLKSKKLQARMSSNQILYMQKYHAPNKQHTWLTAYAAVCTRAQNQIRKSVHRV